MRISNFGQDVPVEPVPQPPSIPDEPQPAPAGVTLSEMLADALVATSEEDSYHLGMNAQMVANMGGLRTTAPIITFEGDFQKPDRMAGKMSVSLLGQNTEIEIISIEDTTYTLDPETEVWNVDRNQQDFLLRPEDILPTDPSDIEDLLFMGEEELDGIQVYHLRGELLDETAFGRASLSQMDYWIEVDVPRIQQVTQTMDQSLPGGGMLPFGGGGSTQDMKSAMVLILRYSDYGEPVSIEVPKELAVQTLLEEGRALAQDLDINGAIAKFEEALALDATLDIDPEAEAKRIAFEYTVTGIDRLVLLDQKEAIPEIIQTALDMSEPGITESASIWNRLCWFGSLYGFAEQVVDGACQWGVDLAGEDRYGGNRDSRGLARALSGDVPGAIEDFAAFIEWANEIDGYSQYIEMREGWIARLQAGENPSDVFDAEMLNALKEQ